MKRYASSLIALVLVATAGCSSAGSSGGLIPQNNSHVTPARDAHPANVVLRIRIPKHTRKRARYVSPATVSATVKITPKAGCGTCSPAQTLKPALVASSSQCKTSPAGLSCSIPVALSEGTYTGSLTTYDSSGATLSENQSFPISITAGKVNTIGVTLFGVPAGVSASLVDPKRGTQSFDASGQETIDIAGANARAQVLLTPVDSDDYVIAGPGAPSMSFAVSGSSGFKADATPGSPGFVTITTPRVRTNAADKLVVVLSGPGCSQPQAVCGSSVTLGFDTLVASASANDAVEVQTKEGTVLSTIALAAGSAPNSVTFDSHGNLFVAGSNMKVSEYAWPYNAAPVATFGKPTFGTSCPGMVLDSKDDAIVGQLGGISVYAPPYSGAPKSQAFVAPQCLALDGSGNLYYVTAYGGGIIIAIPPPFFTGTYKAVSTSGIPTQIATDSASDTVAVVAAGYLWEYDKSLNVIKQSPSYMGSSQTGLAFGNGDFIVGMGTNGTFWAFSEAGLGNAGGGYTPSACGAVTFDAQGELLVADASDISIYAKTATWNQQARIGFLATPNAAIAIATWP